MKTYLATAAAGAKSVALDDMILTKALPTTAGSMMLDGYLSLFDATVVEKLQSAGYSVAGKLNVGEFGFDVIGESSYYGAVRNADGSYASAAALALDEGGIDAVVTVDINGAPRRSAAQSGKVFIKPTYGTVSRYGTVAVACSGETVGVMADCADS
ncbi:MAG: Asp-tRNA(Asn)/Glu-tRNA(Gln) amidotransferase GatCAB subunit A, partial [Clostridia bacterium]|nr:Asp-tRNA(Asn)/Glu-tRNA(Gln) amidotransferase GatCAB subunit A [Clostridia bacterium]